MATSEQLVKLYFIPNHDKLAYGLFKINPELITEKPYTPGINANFEILDTTPEYSILKYASRSYARFIKNYASGKRMYLKYKCKNYYLAFSFTHEDPADELMQPMDTAGRSVYLSELDLPRDVLDKLLDKNVIEDHDVYGYAINFDYVRKKIGDKYAQSDMEE